VSTAIRQMDEMTQHNAALVEETNAAIEQTENQANDLDRIVDQFVVSGATRSVARPEPRRAAVPASRAPAKAGARALQEKVSSAAKSYLSRGNTAVKDEEWSEF
jgi:methyl-accepting chemotaxis protein